jgi:hypothetical protein
MPWIRLDDQFPDHPKVIAAGPMAAWLYVCGIGYCNRLLTDGLIPKGQVRKLADVDEAMALAARLVEVGLWEEVESGYRIHDFLDYQPSAEQVKAERADNAKRQHEWRERKKQERNTVTNTVTDGVSNAPRNAPVTGAPYPSQSHPVPIPSTSPDGEEPPIPPATDAPPAAPKAISRRQEQGFDAFWQAWPKKEGKARAQTAWARIRPDPDTIQAILDAIPRHQAAKDWPRENWRFCPLPATWLNERRWDDELPDTVPRPFAPVGRDAERVAVMQRFAARRQTSLRRSRPRQPAQQVRRRIPADADRPRARSLRRGLARHIDRPTLLAAMRIYKANGKAFFPTIPEFLAAVRSVQRVSGGELPSPTEAWGTFLKKLYRWNPDIARGNPDAEIARVGLTPLELECARRLGGFWALRFMSDHDIQFKAKAFETYLPRGGRAARRRGRPDGDRAGARAAAGGGLGDGDRCNPARRGDRHRAAVLDLADPPRLLPRAGRAVAAQPRGGRAGERGRRGAGRIPGGRDHPARVRPPAHTL